MIEWLFLPLEKGLEPKVTKGVCKNARAFLVAVQTLTTSQLFSLGDYSELHNKWLVGTDSAVMVMDVAERPRIEALDADTISSTYRMHLFSQKTSWWELGCLL